MTDAIWFLEYVKPDEEGQKSRYLCVWSWFMKSIVLYNTCIVCSTNYWMLKSRMDWGIRARLRHESVPLIEALLRRRNQSLGARGNRSSSALVDVILNKFRLFDCKLKRFSRFAGGLFEIHCCPERRSIEVFNFEKWNYYYFFSQICEVRK